MPKKSMPGNCKSGKGSQRQSHPLENSSTRCLRSRSIVAEVDKVVKNQINSGHSESQSLARSPILTRSRSRSLGLQNSQISDSAVSPMDWSSQKPLDHSLKRKSDPKIVGECSKESVSKKVKSTTKKSKATTMSNVPSHSKNELNKANDISSKRCDSKDSSGNRNQPRGLGLPDGSNSISSTLNCLESSFTSSGSNATEASRSNLLDTLSSDQMNNLNLDDPECLAAAVPDFLLSCSRLTPGEASDLPHFSYDNENELSNESRLPKYELLKNKSERKVITKSDFQKSLFSAMQRTRSCQTGNRSAESQPDSSKPGGSGTSDFHNVLRIKVEQDENASKEQCKFSKSSNLRDSSFQTQGYFNPPSSSSGASNCAFHDVSVVKTEIDSPSPDDISNPFLARRIYMTESMDSESSVQGISSSNPAALSADSLDGEIGRLHALMESKRIPLSLFGHLESRMQQLFQKSMGTATSSRAQQLLQELQAAADDDEHQLQILIEISQLLVMGNEDTLIGFPVKQIVPILIQLLLKEYNFELMNQACRALTYLIEALPRSSSVVVEAIPILLNKIQVIQCIDVAEQALTALKMLSKWHSKGILQAKGISACLMHLDFFSINAQRTALAIIANCCQNILPHEFNLVQDSLPILSGWLTHQDEKSVESICLAFSGLVECFQNDHVSLMQIGSQNLLTNIQQLLVVSPPIISSQIFTAVIHMLATMCSSCSEIVVFLLKQNFAETLHYLLISTTATKENIELTPRSPHEYLELSSLICEIMPCLPIVGIFSINNLIVEAKKKSSSSNSVIWQWKDDTGVWHSYEKNDSKSMEDAYQRGNVKLFISDRLDVDLRTMEQFDEATGSSRQLRRHITNTSKDEIKNVRKEFFDENAELVISSIKTLFPVLYEIYCSSAGSTVKHKCLKAMLRMIYYAPPDVLHHVLAKQTIARHIAAMLASQEFRTIIAALQLAEILMQKLPADFRIHFIREGVLHEIKALIKIDPKTWQMETPPEASTSFSSIPSGSGLQAYDCFPEPVQILKADNAQGSTSTLSAFPPTNSQATSSQKEDDNSAINVASKIRDALKRRYMTIKRTFGASDKDIGSLCGNELPITVDNRKRINTWIRDQAQQFGEKYFGVDQISSHPVINVLNLLTNAVKGLESAEDSGLQSLTEIRDVVSQNDISSFELIHSGLVKKLEMYLSAEQSESMPFRSKTLEDRLRIFLHVFIGSPSKIIPEIDQEKFDTSPLIDLISKLNACVSHLEQFPVKVYDQPSNGNSGRPGTSIMKILNMHQLKCLFQRHPSCTTLRQWHSGPVMIDPLASVHNVDRYLVNQGFGNVKEDEDSESDLSYDDSSDEDGGLIVADIRMDHGQGTPKLQFLIGKNVLPYNMTLYQAVRQYGSGEGQSSGSSQNMDCEYPVGYASVWLKTHTIWYRPIPLEDSGASANPSSTSQSSASKKKGSSSRSSHSTKAPSERTRSSKVKKDSLWDNGIVPDVAFPSTFVSKLAGFESVKDPSLEVIHLLRVLHGLSCHWGLIYARNSWLPLIQQASFINNQLTLKVNRQLQDPLAIMTGNTPAWVSHVAYNFPFLFPFETRHLLFYVTSFDRERALQRLIDTIPDLTNAEKITPRLERRRRTVSRNGLLKQAEVVLQDHGDSKALLEIQYKNEVGTGLGPTLEFYALVSKELQRVDLEMWHAIETVSEEGKESLNYVHSPTGLFPMPVSRNPKSGSLTKVCNKFKLLGRFLAKALMDSRLVDIPLSLAFYKWMLNQEKYLSLTDLKHVDESLAKHIAKLEQIVILKKKLERDSSLNSVSLRRSLESITLDGCSIEGLCLDFTLPGYSRIELKKGGKDVPVSIHNLEEYLKLLKYWTLSEGVSKQMKAFREGFESVFSLNRLQVFYPEELGYLLCGNVQNQWDLKSLTDSCRPAHGYTHDSQAIKFLFEILCNYNVEEQRQFIQFITGSPRLPIGGLKSLSHPLTIVKKTSDEDDNSDNYLPSVMTCVNYLKLPDYSSREVMQEKLRIAINEGQHCFHLS